MYHSLEDSASTISILQAQVEITAIFPGCSDFTKFIHNSTNSIIAHTKDTSLGKLQSSFARHRMSKFWILLMFDKEVQELASPVFAE